MGTSTGVPHLTLQGEAASQGQILQGSLVIQRDPILTEEETEAFPKYISISVSTPN